MSGIHPAGYFSPITNFVRTFLIPDAGINVRDSNGRTALAQAVEQGREKKVRALLNDARLDLNARDLEGRTPISLAAERGLATIVEMLLDRDANPNLKDFSGATPLSLAAMRGQDDVVRLLLSQPSIQSRAKVKARSAICILDTPCTPLRLAVEHGHCSVAEMLLSYINMDEADGDQEPILHVAVARGNEDMVRILLRKKVDPNACIDEKEATALHYAVSWGHLGLVALLLSQASVLPDLTNKRGETPAFMAVARGRDDMLRLLLSAGANPEAKNAEGVTLLGKAAEQGFLPSVELLLATDGVDVDSRGDDGRTPLSRAVGSLRNPSYLDSKIVQDRPSIVRCLLDSGCVDVNSRDVGGRTPLIYASMEYDGVPLLRMLLDDGRVDINVMDEEGETPLSCAMRCRRKDNVAFLLARGADPNLGRCSSHETPLFYAVSNGDLTSVVSLLSQDGIDVSRRDCNGHTVLCQAAQSRHVEVVDRLLAAEGMHTNIRCSRGQTPLHHAADGGHEGVLRLLLARDDVDANAQDDSGRTPLHYVAKGANEMALSALLEGKNVDLNCRDAEGRTPLSVAAGSGSVLLVKMLLSLDGVMPDLSDNTGRTPLSWAAMSQKNEEVVKQLLRADGVDPNTQDQEGWTPLSWAVRGKGAGNLIKVMLTEGADRIDINRRDRWGRTPLVIALEKGEDVVVGQLRAAGAGSVLIPSIVGGSAHEIDDAPVEDDEHAYWKGSEEACSDDRPRESRRSISSDWFGHEPGSDASREWRSMSESRYRRTPSMSEEELDLEDQGEYRIIPVNLDTTTLKRNLRHGATSTWVGLPLSSWLAAVSKLTERLRHHFDTHGAGEGVEDALCRRCKTLDPGVLFALRPRNGFAVVTALGKVDKRWASRPCAMCRLIEAVSPPYGGNTECDLCVYSSTTAWLLKLRLAPRRYFESNWADTVILGLEGPVCSPFKETRWRRDALGSRRLPDSYTILPAGFIGRVGSNDRNGGRSLTIHRLQADSIDFGRARSWIDCCKAHHGRPCAVSSRRRPPDFRLIDCATRNIVDGQPEADQYVALSYVWGPLRKQRSTTDRNRVDKAENVVEDAIIATIALGYKYLWVDRYCIAVKDPEVRKKQLLSMHRVYENAEVTIVAAAGQDSTFGLPGVSSARPRVPPPSANIQGHILAVVPEEPSTLIKRSVWWTRGWTYQEGLLSRRRLVFTEHEISFECRGMVARESVELPTRIRRIAATDYPLDEDARLFPHLERGRSGYYIWSRIREYTERRLTYDHDILNAMLGIMKVFAERKPPVYHLCGVPLVRERSDNMSEMEIPTLLEVFTLGLCWWLYEPGGRREKFPSWSWTGWRGAAWRPEGSSLSLKHGLSIEISMVPRDLSSRTVPWSEFEAMKPEEKASLPQDYRLRITAIVVEADLCLGKYKGDWQAILYSGDDAIGGSLRLSKDPVQDTKFSRRLTNERWLAIALGYDGIDTLYLLLLDKLGDYWERVGVIRGQHNRVLDVSRGVKQTFLLT